LVLELLEQERRGFQCSPYLQRYWNNFIALMIVCNTPRASGIPTHAQASVSCQTGVVASFGFAILSSSGSGWFARGVDRHLAHDSLMLGPHVEAVMHRLDHHIGNEADYEQPRQMYMVMLYASAFARRG
jgi:hypothetical protein